ncbi:barrier-to-autointegration factor-like [Amphibalanus amphitrite]|uniref:barrier-to-autointegration factor-like n=1 Tax=Amphibalanus amphitrite TaxID=1232801 RepID=UPI001C905D1F|nr:barrier-to-autointegration factor-like [Amphibalanus amphitrite]
MEDSVSECLTQKCVDFINTPIGGKTIEDVPGIGKVYGCRLRKAGLCKARDILDVFLSFGTGCEFRSWLAYTAGSNSDKAFMTYKCLKEWCKNFLPRARC